MRDENVQAEKNAPGTKPVPMRKRALDWAQRLWRPAGTAIAVVLALLLTWHVINGSHGLSVWQQKRAEDRALAAGDQGPGAGERAKCASRSSG